MSTDFNHYEKDAYEKNKKTDCSAILECGRGIFRTLPKSDFDALNPTTGNKPIPLAEVTIDTRKLYKPCVKIEYSSIINTMLTGTDDSNNIASGASLTLTFRLVRKCKCEDDDILHTWTYERNFDGTALPTGGVLTTRDTFAVTFCECFDCTCYDEKYGKCCTYTLQLVQVVIDPDDSATYTINEKDISAVATCSSCIY